MYVYVPMSFVTYNCCDGDFYVIAGGAYEPPKEAKERATTMYARVPSKYKFKRSNFQNLIL